MIERIKPLARRYWFDALVLAAFGTSIAVAVTGQGVKDGPEGPLWFDLFMAAAVLLLLARRIFPFWAPVAVGVALAAGTFVDGTFIPYNFVAFMTGCVIAFMLGLLHDRRESIVGLGIVIAVVAIVYYNDPASSVAGLIAASLLFATCWTVGFALGRRGQEALEARERAERAEREREDQARLAVAEERARIARELHDVVGHAVSVMTVQAAGVRRLLKPEQEREREALEVVEQTGRDALAEMRRMVGVLRSLDEAPELAPQPSLEHVDKLVEQARNAGLPVELRFEGDPVALPAGVDLTAYRIVQEGLTNATKHARAEHAEVLVRYDDSHLELTISDDGRGGGDGGSGGHGLVGMRERVSVYGGELEAGPRPEGGFTLRARLPIA